MRVVFVSLLYWFIVFLGVAPPLSAQRGVDGKPVGFPTPVNDVTVDAPNLGERRVLAYEPVRTADVMWKQFTWRVIDIREKMNLPFAYPERPFMQILLDAASDQRIALYSTVDDDFSTPLSAAEQQAIRGTFDTILVGNPLTGQSEPQVIFNQLDVASVQRFRLKEVWFVDRESSTLKVRIVGIAPIIDEYDEYGNFLYERPLFWVNYPAARAVLAGEMAFTYGNAASLRSWEDVLESRYFSSYVYKANNVYDRRIRDYAAGRSALLEGEKISQSIFNYAHDLGSY